MVVALLTFAVIPVSVMGLAGYLRARSLLQEQVASQLHTISEIQVDALDQSMRTKEIRLSRIGRRPAFLDAVEKLHRFYSAEYSEQLLAEFDIVNRPDGIPVFQNFFVINHDGQIFAASKNEWIGLSLADAPYYSQLGEEVGTTGIYDFSPIYSQQFSIFSKIKLFTESGEYLGILVGVTESETIRSYLNNITASNPSTSAYFISSNDVYIGIDPYTKALTSFEPDAEQKQILSEYLADPLLGETVVEFEDHEDISVVAHAHSVDRINSDLVIGIPRDIAFGQLGSLAPFSIFLFFITLLVMGVVLWMATNRVVNPLLELATTTHNFAEGNWESRSPIKRDDEIGALAHSFNQMADELTTLYTSLSNQVDERTEYIRTAAEVAQNIVSTFNFDELLQKTARLIVKRFGYYHAGIFMVERSGKVAILRAAHGPSAETMLERGHRLDVGSASIVGWVTENNRPRAASDVGDDPVHFKNELLPETRAEVGIPIAIGDTVLGVLDVQSTSPEAFDEATIAVLVTLSNQIATAIQNVNLFESSDVNLHELERLYRASKEIAQEKTLTGLLEATSHILHDAPFVSAIFTPKGKGIGVFSFSDPDRVILHNSLPEFIDVSLDKLVSQTQSDLEIYTLRSLQKLPKTFTDIPRKIGCTTISLLPILSGEKLEAVIMIGSLKQEKLTLAALQPYVNLIDMVAVTLDKIQASELTTRRLSELEAISIMNQTTATAEDLDALYPALHEQIRQILGDYSFVVALYDDVSDTIQVPYLYENGEVASLTPFPLGEGLTSIIIHTGQPLMIVEDTEKRSAALGAKLVGKPAKSWLGSPLHIGGKVIGALIVQDLENERSFDENSLRFVNTLASQVSGAIHNIRLLEDSRQRAIQLESAAEIARDISSSLHLDDLLNRAVNMIRDRFSFYHASVFLIDHLGEYAIIRESTGEAGTQLKRKGHKLGVGSKSIVGYVSSRGENLIIENTDRDATYYANPLLPDTRAEAALPLKVGERILGVLDIQSTKPYVFPEEVLQILTIIADQLAVAVINTELFADTQEHLSQHRLLHHITTSAASGTTLEEALHGAVQGLQVTMGGDRVAILLVNEKEKSLKIGAAIGYSEDDLANINIPIGSGITGWAARNKKTVRIDNAPEDPRYISVSTNTRSELAVPLLFRNELLGVLNAESERVGAYSKETEEMLGTLAGSLAAIIANARLLQQVRRQAERERMLYEVTSKIRRSTNIQTILTTTADELTKALGAQHTQVKIAVENQPETETDNEQ
jgi:GAF domain-containing protein/HAMP domain-containing protein